MPPFSYSYTPSSLANQIESLMAQGGTNAANAITQAAAAQAAGISGAGQTYSKGLQQLGQRVAQAPKQYQDYQTWLKSLTPKSTDALIGATGPGGLGLSPSDYYSAIGQSNPLLYGAQSATPYMTSLPAGLSSWSSALASPALSLASPAGDIGTQVLMMNDYPLWSILGF